MKLVIPVAGVGSRLKPHTHTTPKPLMEVAGKPMIDYVIEEALKIEPEEIIFVVGYKKEAIMEHVQNTYPKTPVRFVEQTQRDGDGSAVRLALEEETQDSELVVLFGDTLIDFNLKAAINKVRRKDALVFVMEVNQPQHYGVVETDSQNNILTIEEKPENPKSNLAIIGAYYFPSLQKVKQMLNSLYENSISIDGEYKIAQVLTTILQETKLTLKTSSVKKWFDCGRPEILLESNKYFLKKYSKQSTIIKKGDSIIIPPCYISKDATITKSIIGPNVSVSSNAIITSSHITNSIINQHSQIFHMLLEDSIIGKEVIANSKPTQLNIGEKSIFSLK